MESSYDQVYIAIDLHANNSVIGYMNQDGRYIEQQQVATTAERLQGAVAEIPSETKYLTLEQGNQAFWAGEQLAPYVDRLTICDPRRNKLVTRSEDKSDSVDTRRLCELLRLGSLEEIWRPDRMGDRRLFYQLVKEYEWIKKQLITAKRRLQATLQHWGYNLDLNTTDYKYPSRITGHLEQPGLVRQLEGKLEDIAYLRMRKSELLDQLEEAGQKYPEIQEFQKMPGCGPVWAHTFSGYIQTPHRFSNRRQLIKFCKLAVVSRTSDGRKLAQEHLSRAGHSSLKNLSRGIWKSALASGDNEVSGFYQASLDRCEGNATHARLNTQRKILISFWSLWKNNQSYRPDKFWAGDGAGPQ